ncbi:cyclic nucleotide-binding domain-containing protein [Georgenia subflava]|uniref:Cyclic nucleotide-binding domain-containing protein n=1 Tax=Georgenia subflava TaxID=1622177 RepID=A0A6N7EK10_9MICO|nr:cyclic nucleotide-binding domain-containing protein [Georgenia subflava]MPV37403.1 cyclic nucleotide-binding domain-containing protein [Georgenia subflava]
MTSLSWIPSDSVRGWLKAGFDVGLAHYDTPPLDSLTGLDQVHQLRADDRFRFANHLSAWAEFDELGAPVEWGFAEESGIVMGSTTVRVASVGATFGGYSLPTLQQEPVVEPGSVHFAQTAGGRTGVPLPRPVPHAPFVLWQAPIVWTTLALTLRSDGTTDIAMPGASAFPRHWVFGPDGALALKSGLTDLDHWMAHSFGPRTPWGNQDSEALVTEAESSLERQLSEGIMRGGGRPEIRRAPAGTTVTTQGEPGEEIFLVLDGVLVVEVDGAQVAQVGPGAVLGERAVLEGGVRTSTLRAMTPVRLAVAGARSLDLEKLRAVAELHRREEA